MDLKVHGTGQFCTSLQHVPKGQLLHFGYFRNDLLYPITLPTKSPSQFPVLSQPILPCSELRQGTETRSSEILEVRLKSRSRAKGRQSHGSCPIYLQGVPWAAVHRVGQSGSEKPPASPALRKSIHKLSSFLQHQGSKQTGRPCLQQPLLESQYTFAC